MWLRMKGGLMALDFRRGSISFDPTRGQTQSEVGAVVFPNTVRRADVSIAGFDMRYNNGDHNVLQQIVEARLERVQDRTVFFRVNFLLRDSSGSIDDPFSGTVNVLVFADIAAPQRTFSTEAAVNQE
jgi:hypothetical protein